MTTATVPIDRERAMTMRSLDAPRAVFVADAATGRPFVNAAGAINTYLAEALRKAGYVVDVLKRDRAYVPLSSFDLVQRLRECPRAELAIFCDLSQPIESLRLCDADRQMVFFHGLYGDPLVWMTRDVDILCGNSRWTRDMLRYMGGFPLWEQKTLLCPDIFERTAFVVCPLPALEFPDGVGSGERLPQRTWKTLSQGESVFGLDISWEADDGLHACLMIGVNAIARKAGDTRRFRLLCWKDKIARAKHGLATLPVALRRIMMAALRGMRLTLNDLYCPLPTRWIAQADVFRLMREARFFLAFDAIPESFGLSPLESVLLGCPVHTNGAGNLRFLLPPDHGIRVHDAETLADCGSDGITRMAAAIYADACARDGGDESAIATQLQQGRDVIRDRYSVEAFERNVASLLNGRPGSPPTHDDLRLARGPLVRSWNVDTGRVLSDVGVMTLSPAEISVIEPLIGRSAAELFAAADARDRDAITALWKKGLLAWRDARESQEASPTRPSS